MNTIYSRPNVVANFRRADRRRRRARIVIACAIGPIVAALSPRAGAGVQLSNVAYGAASLSERGSITTIRTATNNTILNFSRFDVAAGSTVDFLQPSSASRVLDRVNSAAPSSINGTILSNGSVYLVNPAGVIFGAGAVVDVNRFYAAAASFSNQDFLNGVDHFTSVSGLVSNSGQIQANQISLIGSQVLNQGSIVAPGGVVAMLAGSDVLVSEQGSHITAKVVPATVAAAPSAGSTQAGSSTIDIRTSPLAAGDVYALAIRHTGVIQASNVVINGGQGQVQVSGSINASTNTPGAVGGNVTVTGGDVNLASADIDVSGPAGGGTVEIGGGPRGTGDLTHADNLSADSNTTIDADATSNGSGGSIVLWSNGLTTSAATLTARGGPLGGNGGYIETSGNYLQVSNSPNASAPLGAAGTWLMDPGDVEIVNNSTNDPLQINSGPPVSNNGSTINNGTIEGSLEAGTNVIVSTDQNTGTGTGNLTQDANATISVDLTSPVTLTLEANLAMNLLGGINDAGGSALSVVLHQLNTGTESAVTISAPIAVNGTLSIVGGNVTISSALTASSITLASGPVDGLSTTAYPSTLGSVAISAAITTTGGGFSSAGTSFTSTGGGTITTNGGAFTVTGQSFENDAAITVGNGTSTSSAFTINTSSSSTGTVNINGAITWAGTGGVTIEGGNDITISSAGSITSAGSAAMPVSIYTTADNLSPSGTLGITVNGTVDISGAFIASGGNFALGSTIPPVAAPLTASSASINTISTGSPIGALTPQTVTISGPVITTGNFDAGGTTSFIANGGGTITTNGGTVDITNTGASIDIGTAVNTAGAGVGGSFTVNGGGAFSNSGTIATGGGNVTLTCTEDCSIGAEINTGGGSFTVISPQFESSAEITDNGTSGAQSLSITTNNSSDTVSIGGTIAWAGAGGITIQSENALTVSGSITSAGAAPVSFFTTSSAADNSITGAVSASGALVVSGGLVTIGTTGSVTAQSIGLNTTTVGVGSSVLTLGTVTVSGPVVSNGGSLIVGGTISFIDNQNGTITTNGGAVNITNTGADIAIGAAVVTGGGAFSTTDGGSFGNSGSGTINTGGGGVTITVSQGAQVSAEINTGGGAFIVTAPTFENDAAITDGGAAAGPGNFDINTTAGSTTGSITLNGAITWTGATGRQVLVESGGDVTLTTTGSISSAGSVALPVSIYTTGASNNLDIAGTVNTSGAFIASGGLVLVDTTGSVTAQSIALNNNSTDSLSNTLTLGTVTVSGPVVTNGGSLIAGGTTFFIDNQNGTITTNGGEVIITNTGADLAIGAAVVTSGGAFITTTAGSFANSGSGTINTGGGAVNITCSQGISVDAEINTGGGAFTVNAPTFDNTAEITDGGVAGSQLLSITTTNTDPNNTDVANTLIDLNLGGDIDWAGVMTFSVPSGFEMGLGANITSTAGGPIELAGVTLALTATSTITGGNISFGSIVNPTSTNTPDLNVVSSGTISLSAVGSSSIPIGSLSISNAGSGPEPTTVLNGDIYVTGNAVFGGTVSLATNVFISDVNEESGDSGNVEFDGPLEGPGGLTADDIEQTRINSSVGDVTPVAYLDFVPGTTGFVFFSAGPAGSSGENLPSSPQAATVVNIASGGNFEVNYGASSERDFFDLFATIDSYGPLTVNIGSASSPNSSNLFGVGQYEKLSALGNLTINTNGGTAVIGDLSAEGNITVNSPNIVFVLRSPTVSGTAELDSGMDLIAAGEITLPANANYSTIAPSQPAAFDIPGFIAESFNPSSNISALAARLNTAISIIPSVSPTAFFSSFGLLYDLTPATLGGIIPTFVPPIPFVFDFPIAGAVPRQQLVAGTVPADFKIAFQTVYPGPVLQQDLKDDGVYTREPTLDEILAATDGMVDYDDLPKKRRPHAGDFAVVVTRMNTPLAREFLASYQAFFGGSGTSPGIPNRRSQIAADIQNAWDAYVSQNGYNPATGPGFQQYCARTPGAAKVSADLVQLNGLFQQLHLLGLSHKEASEAFQYNILAGLSANGMQDRDLTTAVENSGPAQ